ncbi:MAG: cardiolipin synthase, partial [Planctomycetaceae bacterium]
MSWWHAGWTTAAIFLADLFIRAGLSARVIMRKRPVGVSLAWLAVILMLPFFGAFVYLFLGERRLGTKRAARSATFREPYENWVAELRKRQFTNWSSQGTECEPLARLATTVVGIPPLADNSLELLTSADAVFQSLIADIDAAKSTCHLEFYIWALGGHADEAARALIRAAARGVTCRVLVDAVGSKTFLASPLAREMQQGGVHIQPALPTGIFRALFVRIDLRLHRKIVVIDGHVAYTGSLNLVDPRYFKQGSGVGQWVDAMVRIRGPAVEALAVTFLADWELETHVGIDKLQKTGDAGPQPAAGTAAIQVLPSGPREQLQGIQEVLLTAIYAARRELIMTTPYFVPDESMLTALISAARRGVEVVLIEFGRAHV